MPTPFLAPLLFSDIRCGELCCVWSLYCLLMPLGNLCHVGGWDLHRKPRVGTSLLSSLVRDIDSFLCLRRLVPQCIVLATLIFTEFGWPISHFCSKEVGRKRFCTHYTARCYQFSVASKCDAPHRSNKSVVDWIFGFRQCVFERVHVLVYLQTSPLHRENSQEGAPFRVSACQRRERTRWPFCSMSLGSATMYARAWHFQWFSLCCCARHCYLILPIVELVETLLHPHRRHMQQGVLWRLAAREGWTKLWPRGRLCAVHSCCCWLDEGHEIGEQQRYCQAWVKTWLWWGHSTDESQIHRIWETIEVRGQWRQFQACAALGHSINTKVFVVSSWRIRRWALRVPRPFWEKSEAPLPRQKRVYNTRVQWYSPKPAWNCCTPTKRYDHVTRKTSPTYEKAEFIVWTRTMKLSWQATLATLEKRMQSSARHPLEDMTSAFNIIIWTTACPTALLYIKESASTIGIKTPKWMWKNHRKANCWKMAHHHVTRHNWTRWPRVPHEFVPRDPFQGCSVHFNKDTFFPGLKENLAGSYKACCHVPQFGDNFQVFKKHSMWPLHINSRCAKKRGMGKRSHGFNSLRRPQQHWRLRGSYSNNISAWLHSAYACGHTNQVRGGLLMTADLYFESGTRLRNLR